MTPHRHKLHETVLLVHEASKRQHEKAKEKKTKVRRYLDGDNFSEPQACNRSGPPSLRANCALYLHLRLEASTPS